MEEVSCLEGGDGELEISDEGQIFFSDPKDLDQKVRVTPPLFRPLLTKFWTSFFSLLARVVGAAR